MNNFIEQLIERVKSNSILYDLSHPDYKCVKKKEKIWEDIGRNLGVEGHIIKKKWKNLKDCYAKHLRTDDLNNGQLTKHLDRYKTWPWAQQMEFMKQFLQFTKTSFTISNFECNSTLIQDGMSTCGGYEYDEQLSKYEPETYLHQESNTPLTPVMKNIYSQKRKFSEEKAASIEQFMRYLEKRHIKQIEYDDVDLLFLGYAKVIKKFSQKRQTIVKFKIAELLMEEELGQIMEDESGLIGKNLCVTPSLASISSTSTSTRSECELLKHDIHTNSSLQHSDQTTILP